MDYKDFTPRQQAYERFIKMRKRVLESVDQNRFAEVFADTCASALDGDCVAQDVAAYFFNRGLEGVLPQNYQFYMSWEILAGANGNEFALEKLEFFLNYALEVITENEQLLTRALQRRNITKNNALMVISNLLCEGIVDELALDPKNLINIPNEEVAYSAKVNRPFLDAVEKSLPRVIDFLRS